MSENYGNKQKHLNPNPIQRYLLTQFHQQILAFIAQTGAKTILDVGCGEGFVLQELRQTYPTHRLFGGDFSYTALTWGRDILQHGAPLTHFDLHQLPFADNTFPLVICLEVLEHVPDSGLALRELARVSAGHVLVSVPHEPFFCLANLARLKHVQAWGNDPEHLHNYTTTTFKAMVSQEVALLQYQRSFPWQIALGQKK